MEIRDLIEDVKTLYPVIDGLKQALCEIVGMLMYFDTQKKDASDEVPIKNNISSIFPPQEKKEKEEETMPKHKFIKTYKRKDGYYMSTVYVRGNRKNFTAHTKQIAFQKAKDYFDGNYSSLVVQTKSNGKELNVICEYYLKHLKKPFISPMYYDTLLNRYNNHIKNYFGKMKVTEVTPMILQEYFEELCGVSTRVAEDVKGILRQVLEYAVGNGYIKVNPMRAVIVEKHCRENGKELSPDEIVEFKQKIENEKMKITFLVFLYTGVRLFECKSCVFDFEKGIVTVDNSKLKQFQKKNAKNLQRIVPILKPLYAYKDEILKYKWQNFTLNDIQSRFGELMPGMRLNYLRHTFQTYCRVKASKEMVNLWSGHVLGKDMTDRVYNHIPLSEQLNVASLIEY